MAAFQGKEVLLVEWANCGPGLEAGSGSWAGGPKAEAKFLHFYHGGTGRNTQQTDTAEGVVGEGVCLVC